LLFVLPGICLVDETKDNLEDSSDPHLAEGIKVAYTIPDMTQSQSAADEVSVDDGQSLEDLMKQMKNL
jgi:hypothetical protein